MDYVPVSCALYDELELYGIRESLIEIEVENGQVFKLVIKTFEARKEDGEFLIGTKGENIRLDRITKINGKSFQLYC